MMKGKNMHKLNLTLRQRKILHALQNQTSMITGAELAVKFNTSTRTIRSDVVTINQELCPYDAKIGSVRSKGYFFTASDPNLVKELNKIDTAFYTPEDRIRYLAFQLCLTDKGISLYELEEEMFISHTTLENDLKRLRQRYTLQSPFITVTIERGFVEFEHDEKKRRHVLNQLYHEYWNYNDHGNAVYGYDFLDSRLLDQITDIIPVHLRSFHIFMEDANIVWLNLACAIMIERISDGHPLPEAPVIPKQDTMAMQAAEEMLDHLESLTNCFIPPWERDEIYQIIASGHIPYFSNLPFQNVYAAFEPVTLYMAQDYIQKILDVFGLDLSNDEDFYITLLHYICYLRTPVHPFNTQDSPGNIKSHLLTETELAWLFQDIAFKYTGNYLNEAELLMLAHCMSGALEFFYKNHPENKIRTVICTHLNMAAAWAIKRNILGAFENYLEITQFIPINAKSAFDFSDTDLILTTVHKKITESPMTDVLEISPYITADDLQNIAVYVSRKRILRYYPIHLSMETLLKDAYWHEDCQFENIFSAIKTLAAEFAANDIVPEDYTDSLLNRESICSNAMHSGILFQSALTAAKKTQLSFAVMKHRMTCGDYKIRVIVTAAFTPEDRPLIFYLKDLFFNLNHQFDIANSILTKSDFLKCLL